MGRKSKEQIQKERKTAINNKSHKKNCKTFLLSFHKEKDKKIIEKMEQQESKCDYVRQLILKDLEESEK